jgi:hypothetical protein
MGGGSLSHEIQRHLIVLQLEIFRIPPIAPRTPTQARLHSVKDAGVINDVIDIYNIYYIIYNDT